MSGIVGIFNIDGQPIARNQVARMAAALERRGPDGTSVWTKGAVGLGHTMLWTAPESKHEQFPFVNPRGDLVITADARIDNRGELIDRLGFDRQVTNNIGDSELILAAYEMWGKGCPERLLGDFAFVIWDERQQLMFCARDHFGVKPFCYYHQPGKVFVFSSEIKALLALQQVPRQVNEEIIADYLVLITESIDHTSTLYQELLKLPPAHTLTVGVGEFSARRYWSLDPSREILYNSPVEYAEHFLEVFTEAVRSRLRSDSKPAFFMSGGMDSSSVVCVARSLTAEKEQLPLQIYSAISDDGTDCESRNIKAVHNLGGFLESTVSPQKLGSFEADIDEFISQSDNYFDNLLFHIPLYITAGRQDVRVMMNGFFGDSLFTKSRDLIAMLLRENRWRDWIAEAFVLRQLYAPDYPVWRTLYKSARIVSVPDWGRQIWRKIRPRDRMGAILAKSIINPDFAKQVDILGRFQDMRKSVPFNSPRTFREEHVNLLNSPNLTSHMERHSRTAAIYSMEARHPYLDRRLVEFCLALPWTTSWYRGQDKVVLRDAMSGLLPDQIISSPRCLHLGPSFSRVWFQIKQLYLGDVVQTQLEPICKYVDAAAVKQAYQRCVSKWAVEDYMKVMGAVNLINWVQRE